MTTCRRVTPPPIQIFISNAVMFPCEIESVFVSSLNIYDSRKTDGQE